MKTSYFTLFCVVYGPTDNNLALVPWNVFHIFILFDYHLNEKLYDVRYFKQFVYTT